MKNNLSNNLNSNSKLKVMVLEGGMSTERYTSLQSGASIKSVLISSGLYSVRGVDLKDIDFYSEFIKNRPDVVFNALQGKYGEDGRIQGMLDILKIPYTHSGLLASAIGMNKWLSKQLCSKNNITVPNGIIINKNDTTYEKIKNIKKPFIIKPNDEGQSLGITIVDEYSNFDINSYNWSSVNEILIEEFISGREFSVTVLDNDFVLDAVEIKSKNKFFDTEAKDNVDRVQYVFNNILDKEKHDELKKIALKVHKILGCKDISRSDFILSEKDNKFYYLETNTHPGLTYPHSLTPMSLENSGYSLLDLCVYLINNATFEGREYKHCKLKKINL